MPGRAGAVTVAVRKVAVPRVAVPRAVAPRVVALRDASAPAPAAVQRTRRGLRAANARRVPEPMTARGPSAGVATAPAVPAPVQETLRHLPAPRSRLVP